MKTEFASYLIGAICMLYPATLLAQQYIYTNNNLENQNTTTALRVNQAGVAKAIAIYSTGGPGAGGKVPGQPMIVTARTASNQCLFVANAGNNTIAAFTLNVLDGSLTTVSGSPFPSGGTLPDAMGLAVGRNQLLLVANHDASLSDLKINADCSLTGPLNIYAEHAAAGLKVTPDGKYLVIANFGPVDSFQISYSDGVLTELGPWNAQGGPASLDISCDSSTVYFGDPFVDFSEIEVFNINSSGQLSEINQFIDHNTATPTNVLLSADGDRCI